MSFFDDASLVMIPSGYKDQKVYSVKPTDGTGDLTFSRASSASRIGPNGLIEKVRSNVALQSEGFDTASWAKANTTITANAGVAPNGTTTADKIVPTTTGTGRWVEQSRAITSSIPYTNSFFVKADGFSWAAIHHIDGSIGAWFNVSSGTIGTITAGCTALITSVGNGWYRCSVAKTSGGVTGYSVVQLADADNSSTATASGTNGLLIWGAQAETGDIATDYIATTTAAVSVGPVSGLPRLDYLGSTCPRLLLEPQRSNLAQYSEQFNNAAWTKRANIGITANAIVSPDGTTNADKMAATNASAVDYGCFQVVANGLNTYSVFAKKAELNYVFVGLNNDFASEGVFFDLNTGAISSNPSSYSATITDYGNGWYRCSVYFATNVSYVFINPSVNGTSFNFSGQSGNGIYIYGAQAELGAYATSYIPTLGASVTRVVDAAVKTSASALIGQTEGTIFWEFEFTTSVATNNEALLNIDNGGFNNTIYFSKGATGSISAEMYNGGVLQASFALSSQPAGTYKAAFGYANNNTAFFVNGVQVGTTDTSCSVPAMSRIQLGNTALGPSTDKTAQLLLFKTRLTNAALAELTA